MSDIENITSSDQMPEPPNIPTIPTMANLTSDFMIQVTDDKMKEFITKLLKNDKTVSEKFDRILMASSQASSQAPSQAPSPAPLETLLDLFNSQQLILDLNSTYTGTHASLQSTREYLSTDDKSKPFVYTDITIMIDIIKKKIVKAIDIEYYKLFYPRLFTDKFRLHLERLLQKHLDGNVLRKKCGGFWGSKSLITGKVTTQSCCQIVCDKMIILDNALDSLFKTYSSDDSVKYYDFSVKDFSKNGFYIDSKDTNPVNYVEKCRDIDLIACSSSAKNLKKFLPVLPSTTTGVVLGGYSKNKYRHSSKKSRKSHRHRRHSTRNKKRHMKRHMKHHTKRYRHGK